MNFESVNPIFMILDALGLEIQPLSNHGRFAWYNPTLWIQNAKNMQEFFYKC